jgi:hypothetical protein
LTERCASASFWRVQTDQGGETVTATAATETAALPMAVPLAPNKKRSRLGRVWQWFWRSDLRRLAQPLGTTQAELLRRARLAAEVARRIGNSPEPLDGSAEPIQCDLHRQSIYWSLRALNPSQNLEPSALGSELAGASPFSGVEPSLLLKAAGNPDALRQVERALSGLTFQDFAVLPPAERANLLAALRGVGAALSAELAASERIVQALWLQRLLRLGLLFVLLAVGVALVAKVRDNAELGRDLAVGKAWRTSSFNGGCHTPEQDCPETPDYFFHSQQEAEPWVEFDLGSKARFSAVRVDNRKDCCTERASPLVVEVSNDQQTWKTVARHEGVFGTWLAEFAATEARWVRLRVANKQAILHLAHVRILR